LTNLRLSATIHLDLIIKIHYMVYKLSAKIRDKKESLQEMRKNGLIPGIVYGPELEENILVKIPFSLFNKLYQEAGESSLVNLSLEKEDKSREVLVKSISRHPVKDMFYHVDFYQIKRGQKLEVSAELVFEGQAPAEKELGGILTKNLSDINIKCLPKDLISEIKVDLSSLKTLNDVIRIEDLNLKDEIEILDDPKTVIATVVEPEEEPEPEEEEAEGEGESEEGEEKTSEEEGENENKEESVEEKK